MKKVFTLLTAALITAQLARFAPIYCAKALNDVNGTGECMGDPGYGTANIPLEKQLEAFLNDPNLTEAQKQAAREKIERDITFRDSAVADSGANQTARKSFATVTLSVPAYTQEEKYYCGPATVRQTLGYLGQVVPGTYYPPSQSTIASTIHTTTNGTEWYNMVSYLNTFSFMGIPTIYTEYVPSSKSNMEDVIYASLTQTNPTPPILQINTNGYSAVMGYSTSGHYMNVSGMKTENGDNYYQVTDPNRGRLPQPLSAKYYLTTEYVWQITQNHWAQHFMH